MKMLHCTCFTFFNLMNQFQVFVCLATYTMQIDYFIEDNTLWVTIFLSILKHFQVSVYQVPGLVFFVHLLKHMNYIENEKSEFES